MKFGREVLDLANRALQTMTDIFPSQVHIIGCLYCHKKYQFFSLAHKESNRLATEKEVEEKVVHFHDDLRAGDFTYVKDSDGEAHVILT